MLTLAPAAMAEDCGFRTPPDISVEKELMITDLSVVNDARAEAADGVWSFSHLVQSMAADRGAGSRLVKDWLRSWETSRTVNGFALEPRAALGAAVTRSWMARDGATSEDDWMPDLAHAPFRLLAIVYRPDLGIIGADGAIASAGEARFVFTALDVGTGAGVDGAPPLPFTVILEYTLPARDRDQVRAWAERWHRLGRLPFGPGYNAALQEITDRFDRPTDGNPAPRLRTNDGLSMPWQFREFHFDAAAGLFANAPVTNTPHLSLIGHDTELSAQINAHPGEDIPLRFIGGSSEIPDTAFRWPPMATANNVVRHTFAMLTCNGCHSGETGRKADETVAGKPGGFRHLGGRMRNERATLSEFLTGNPTVVTDPNGKLLLFCDLKLRQKAMSEALHAAEATKTSPHPPDLSVARGRRERTD
ncbi:MAG: hypothetical protein ACLP8B_09025 [Xanthobacteraceae bacterium]